MLGLAAGLSNEISVSIKKTVNIRPYEPEVIEATLSYRIDSPLTCYERMYLLCELQAELESQVFEGLMARGLIQFNDFRERLKASETQCNKSRDKLIEMQGEGALKQLWTKITRL